MKRWVVFGVRTDMDSRGVSKSSSLYSYKTIDTRQKEQFNCFLEKIGV